MKFLFLCAHQDDLEFAVPSLIISIAGNPQIVRKYISRSKIDDIIKESRKYITKDPDSTDFEIKVACMTRGEMSDFTVQIRSTLKAAQIRTEELNKSQNILGGIKPDYLGFFDGFIRVTENAIETVKNYIIKIKPDYIIAPEAWLSYYHHPDHLKTGKIAYYAIMRLINDRKEKKTDIKIPKLFYYNSLMNDFYFPRYSIYRNIINRAMEAHKSQAELLSQAKIPSILEEKFHGMKISGEFSGEALRYQPLPGNPDIPNKKIKGISWNRVPFYKKIIWILGKKIIWEKLMNYDYKERYNKYFDGKIEPRMTELYH
ncbi:MAG: PIG-L family deacetylase [archaeon]|nr:PIG-L family deacetylase [archaeon]